MNSIRRRFVATLALASVAPDGPLLAADTRELPGMSKGRLVLSNFEAEQEIVLPGARWRGFSDRVMGGVSDAELSRATVAGKRCIRLTGRVTRDSGGGFIQMALDLGSRGADFDGSAWTGVEFLVYGNDEDYNVHVRTADCGWYDESYRATVRVGPRWQSLRIPWSGFTPNGLSVPLNPARLQRIALLGWMREFTADIALAEAALYT
jgi:hypothetical protein